MDKDDRFVDRWIGGGLVGELSSLERAIAKTEKEILSKPNWDLTSAGMNLIDMRRRRDALRTQGVTLPTDVRQEG